MSFNSTQYSSEKLGGGGDFNFLLSDMAIEKLWSKAFAFNRLHARRDNVTIIIK